MQSGTLDLDRELASWRLTEALIERHPGRFAIYELHPGSGLYDCLCLRPMVGSITVWLNRNGSIQVETAGGETVFGDGWERAAGDGLGDVVRDIERHAGLRAAPPSEEPIPALAAVQVITAALEASRHRSARRWCCLNGVLDTSGEGGGVRDHLFARFPAGTLGTDVVLPTDPFGMSAYRFWFVGPEDGYDVDPVFCVDTSGVLAYPDGRTMDLTELDAGGLLGLASLLPFTHGAPGSP